MTRAMRAPARLLVGAGLGTVAVVVSAGPAGAHVGVDPSTAVRGSESVFSFQVPDEDPTAATTKVVLVMPEGHPIASVQVRSTPGWTADVTRTSVATPLNTDDGPVTDVVTRVVWVADSPADRIAPEEFQTFVIAAGPLPRTKWLVFKVLQYRSDGAVVRWIDPPASGPEPPHPAPAVRLVAEGSDPAPAQTSDVGGSSGPGRLAVAALVGAGLALTVAGLALRGVVRHTGSHPPEARPTHGGG